MKKYTSEILKKERWLCYLAITSNQSVNRERVERIADITGNETLEYVMRSLQILEEEVESGVDLSVGEVELIRRTLQWSEVAKGGSEVQRKNWMEKGYPLEIHNIASAQIYMEESDDDENMKQITELLIRTHGIAGQSIRGEVSVLQNAPLKRLRSVFSEEKLYTLLLTLNKCIIKAVRQDLWSAELEEKISKICRDIVDGKLAEFSAKERLRQLSPAFRTCDPEELERACRLFETRIFPFYELWYFESALSGFSASEICQIFELMLEEGNLEEVIYISFKPLADHLFYDYEKRKKINVYKMRIIEKCLKNHTNDNVRMAMSVKNQTLQVDFEFSGVCEKLIAFCVEAERSGILTFEKSITVLYDMFGFRRDEFDRLNNEEKYLATMNDTEESTKNSIVDYAAGDVIVDVGSGGGVLLDLLEKTFPDKQIVGTDISTNVIAVLNEKKVKEGHRWQVFRHNFTEAPMTEVHPSSIIFSSILHEIFSYTETEQGRFQIDSVKKALKHAYDSLQPGGKIIIRDGVKAPEDPEHKTLAFSFASRQGLDFFRNYCKDFKGLPEVSREDIRIEGLRVEGDYNFMREFLYTYTWGQESYACEVNEQFGYFTLEEFKEFFTGLGARILKAEAFVEQGYIDHLTPLVSLDPEEFPLSNCILVVEK